MESGSCTETGPASKIGLSAPPLDALQTQLPSLHCASGGNRKESVGTALNPRPAGTVPADGFFESHAVSGIHADSRISTLYYEYCSPSGENGNYLKMEINRHPVHLKSNSNEDSCKGHTSSDLCQACSLFLELPHTATQRQTQGCWSTFFPILFCTHRREPGFFSPSSLNSAYCAHISWVPNVEKSTTLFVFSLTQGKPGCPHLP